MLADDVVETTPEVSQELEKNEKILISIERKALNHAINELFVNLCDSDNFVRQALFDPANLDRLCEFVGAKSSTDILMHMITLLNDKKDWRMRATFFESCPIVAKHLGQNKCRTLKPFLQQVSGFFLYEQSFSLNTVFIILLICI